MKFERIGMALVLAVGLAVLPGCVGEKGAPRAIVKGGDERTGAYDAVANYWKPAPDQDDEWTWGEASGVAADNPDRVIYAVWGDKAFPGGSSRAPERPNSSNYIVVVDGDGNVTERWSQWDSLFNRPHHVYISPYDPERHVWVIERGGGGISHPEPGGVHEQILKFTNDGSKLVMQLRDPNPVMTREVQREMKNPGPLDFGQESTMAFLPDGSFLVTDGYTNSRVIKFSADGEYMMEWGELGTGPGQFDLIHGIDVDRNGRVYVADRGNSRIQVFTPDGEFIEEWPGIFFPVDLHIDENDALWVVSAVLNRFLKFDLNGELQYSWGTYGGTAGGFGPGGPSRPHQMDVDQEGNVYAANWDTGHWDKYIPKPGADPSKLIGRHLIIPQ